MRMLFVGAVLAVSLAACANSNYPDSGSSSYSCNSNAGLIGGLAGAAGGALLGNQFGKGTGKYGTTALGALGGGAGGYALGNSMSGC